MRHRPPLAAACFAATAWLGCAHGAPGEAVRTLGSAPYAPGPDVATALAIVVARPGDPQLVAVLADSDTPVALGTRADPPTLEDLQLGSDAPWLSPDGRRAVYFRDGVPHVLTLATGELWDPLPPRGLPSTGLLRTGTPDGRSLVMYRFERYAEGDESGPDFDGVLERIDFGLGSHPLPDGEGDRTIVYGVLADGRLVLVTRAAPSDSVAGARLWLLSLPDDAETTVWEATPGASISQVMLSGSRAVYESEGRIEALELDGPAPVEAADVFVRGGSFAEYQWPTIDSTGTRVAYTHELRTGSSGNPYETRIELAELGDAAPRVIRRCSSRCRATFETDRTLLVEEGDDLVRVPLEGEASVLIRDAAYIAVRGR